jgi:NAD(P)-dependent dehydrogenase (short-subunit alcohol dehydrogenase family)
MRAAFDFRGASVLVTGGSNGIGLGIARSFAAAGADVIITGTRASVSAYEHDLSTFAYRQCLMGDVASLDMLARDLERVDVLVNNAGFTEPGGRSEYEPGVFEEVVQVDLVGPFRLAMACKPLLRDAAVRGGAAVVNVASFGAFFGLPRNPGYGAAKAGLVQLTKALAVGWAPDGIRVNAVAPGIVASNMTAGMEGDDAISAPILARTPLGRFGTPDDVAPAVLFLASDAARYITGQTLRIDGGRSILG